MKIGVISDTHIPDRADRLPQQVLDAFKGVDMVIHAGDLVNFSVIDELKKYCANVKVVCGNMDSDSECINIPKKEIITVGNFRIGLMHGYGSPASLIENLQKEFKFDNVNMVIFGHSHNAVNEERGGVIFFNPGSPTDKVFARYNSYGIIEINDHIKAKIIKL
jgi:putative phosphoesterase